MATRTGSSATISPEVQVRMLVSNSFVEGNLLGVGLTSPLARRALERASIPEDFLARKSMITDQQLVSLIVALRRLTRDELWGLSENGLAIGAFREACSAAIRERTLLAALRRCAAVMALTTSDFRLRISKSHKTVTVAIVDTHDMTPRRQILHGVVLFAAYCVMNWLAGARLPLDRVEMKFQPAEHSAGFARTYRAPAEFDAPRTALHFDAEIADQMIAPDEAAMMRFLAQMPETLVRGYRDQEKTSQRALSLLRRDPSERLSLEEIADRLAMSPATFSRRLKEEGFDGFLQLKDRARREAACLALAQTDASLEQIALNLGFSESSSFHRAFKRWTGQNPGDYRADRRGASV